MRFIYSMRSVRSVILGGGTILLICGLLTIGGAGVKPASQSLTSGVTSALLPADAPASSTTLAANTRVAALAADAAYCPNFCASAQHLRHWSKTVLTVRILSSETEAGRDVAEPIIKGMGLWNKRTAPYLSLVPTDSETADITISFVPAGSLKDKAVGQTDVRFRLADQVLTRAAIHINDRLSDAQLTQVAAHELGHALGIQGHSTDPRDLMFTHAHLPAQVTERDANTMFVSYGIPAQKGTVLPRTVLASFSPSASPADLPTDDDPGTK